MQSQSRYNFRRNQLPLSANNANTAAVKKTAVPKSKPVEVIVQPPSLANSITNTVSQLVASKSHASALKFASLLPHLSLLSSDSSHLISITSLYFDMEQYRACLHHIRHYKLHIESSQALFLAAKCHVSSLRLAFYGLPGIIDSAKRISSCIRCSFG